MKLETLKNIMDISKRRDLYENILTFFENLDELDYISYDSVEISEGLIPIITISKINNIKDVKYLKVFVGAQHNEYNGLFGILEFFESIKNSEIRISDILLDDQVLIFFPLMNTYGFLNPSLDNKSGYYLKNGSNLNRFWRFIFVPNYEKEEEIKEFPFPEQCTILKSKLQEFWDEEKITICLIDFHETSLLKRFPRELSIDLSLYYKFNHWLKEAVVENIIELYNIPYFRKPLFFKCNSSADHNHINLTYKQIDTVLEKMREYQSKNFEKLPFYFCYSHKSENYCKRLANIVYSKLNNILWETKFTAYPHEFHDHGCFVKMSDATTREKVFSMELESQKQFFNLFDEIEASKNDPEYFGEKLEFINLSLTLVKETIKTMIDLR